MRKLTSAVFLLALMLAWPAAAATLMTNAVPVQFWLPRPVFTGGVFYGGDLGYAIYVPPGATTLTIEMTPNDPLYAVDLLVRYAADVGYTGVGSINFDYSVEGGTGTKTLVINGQSRPPLQTGTYYIGFKVFSIDLESFITLTATVEGGSVLPSRTITSSTFDKDLDGWTRNAAPSDLPGASLGALDSSVLWQPTGGRPGGFVRHDKIGAPGVGALVAPAKFLGNLGTLPEGRFEFDFLQIAGSDAVYPVEIRVFGSGAAFSWVGSIPPSPPLVIDTGVCTRQILNPATGQYDCASPWTHYAAVFQEQLWHRMEGEASFAKVFSNVQRIEVIMDLSLFGESSGLDNFALVSRSSGPPLKVLAGNTSFVSGPDGWTRNYPASDVTGATTGNADSTFRWAGFEGNPTGYIRLNNSGGPNRDFLVAPARFLGNYSDLANGQFEFDYEYIAGNAATRPVELRLVGADSVYAWTGGIPAGTWTHYIAPLKESAWRRISGVAAFADVLANVQRIEISADQVDGPESDGVDNFWLLPGPGTPAPPAISANPTALAFSALAGGPNPAAQVLGVTSIGGGVALNFSVAATAAGKNWLRVSASNGTTPRALTVWPDITGLPEGTYIGRVTVTSTSATLGPQTVDVSLSVKARSGSTPRVNPGGVVNAASARQPLSPGALGTIYGSGLGPATPVAATFLTGTSYLPTRLQGTRVLVKQTDGVLISEAPLLYLSDAQINFQLPFELLGRSEALIVVENNGVASEPRWIQVVPYSPGIFTFGENRALAVNEDNTVNTPDSAAARGSVLTVYMTGQGVVTPSVPTGSAAPSRPLARAPYPAQAWIGGVPAQVQFVGLAPNYVGVLQVNILLPGSAPVGDVPLTFSLGGSASNSALVSVR